MTRLERTFFARDTLTVARGLLGQRLVRVLGGERASGLIVEVEAYVGEEDRASHARSGRTARNSAMYGPAGHAYVYFIYGMHHCLNVVTERDGFPAAVLIRALEPVEGVDAMRPRRSGRDGVDLTSGPARLCQALEIDRSLDGADLCAPEACLYVEVDEGVPDEAVDSGPRVGVRGDGAARGAPWRIFVRDSPHVSR